MKSQKAKLFILLIFVAIILMTSFFLFNTYVKKAIEIRQNAPLDHVR